ncbi:hypothetical protein [Oscillibacter sp.]|uniref:hypothetical protein n=1 Tax=Oscillibacter sp. TaxID=1945593 RepID=UPI0028AAFD6A|nr:hypothetical protein [Oscillibacter sp.]
MKKAIVRISALIFALCCLVTTSAFAVSSTSVDTIQLRYTGIDSVSPYLTISSKGYATCNVVVQPSNGYSVDVTLELQQDGTSIKSWSGSATYPKTLSLGDSLFVVKGHSYQVVANAVIKNSSGRVVSSPTSSSKIVSY